MIPEIEMWPSPTSLKTVWHGAGRNQSCQGSLPEREQGAYQGQAVALHAVTQQ